MSAAKIAKEVGGPLLLVSVALGCCFLALEVTLRMLGFDRMGAIAQGRALILRESDHPERLYELTPNSSGFAWRTQVQINSHGMRDREYPLERSQAPRIALLGDSVAFGSGVAMGERFSDHLEDLLAESYGGPVEVLNFGVGGYDTLQEVATLEDIGLPFAPDLVLLAYCVNDVIDNSPNLEYIRSLESRDSWLYRLRSVQFLRTTLDRLTLTRRLRSDNRDDIFAERFRDQIVPLSSDPEIAALRREFSERFANEPDPNPILEFYRSDAHLGKLAYALGRLRDLAREHGFDVIVAIIPFLGESPSYEVVYRMVQHLVLSDGFEPVSLAFPLSRAGLESLRRWPKDGIHPGPRGHRVIAEALAPALGARIGARATDGPHAAAAGPR